MSVLIHIGTALRTFTYHVRVSHFTDQVKVERRRHDSRDVSASAAAAAAVAVAAEAPRRRRASAGGAARGIDTLIFKLFKST